MQYAFDGPGMYQGKDLHEAHAHLIHDKGLNVRHFDLLVGYFVASLKELGVAQEQIAGTTQVKHRSQEFASHCTSS